MKDGAKEAAIASQSKTSKGCFGIFCCGCCCSSQKEANDETNLSKPETKKIEKDEQSSESSDEEEQDQEEDKEFEILEQSLITKKQVDGKLEESSQVKPPTEDDQNALVIPEKMKIDGSEDEEHVDFRVENQSERKHSEG